MKNAVLGGVAVVVLAVAGVLIWFYSTTGIEGTGEVTAPTLTAPSTTNAGAPESDDTSGDLAEDDPGATIYELTDESLVVFEIDEILNGNEKTVVATNREVAAQLSIDTADLSTVRLGTVVVGAQTFETDSGNRNRAIRGPILDAAEFQTIEFVPTSVDGLEGAATEGETYEFTITGDLTIREITSPVTFDVTATFGGDSISGTAEATVLRETYELQIPSVPSVAGVDEDVLLRIEFVAAPT